MRELFSSLPFAGLFVVTLMPRSCLTAELPRPGEPLSDEQVAAFARLALAGIEKEYPHKPGGVLVGPHSVVPPRDRHPVFYGCYDWHSSVHGHWMLVRLLRLYPHSSVADETRCLLRRRLTADGLRREAAYFAKDNQTFERMYGWAWALRLAAELRTWDDADACVWASRLAPLENRLVELTQRYLPRLTYPVRSGAHRDTAFALAQMLDYARLVCNREFEQQIVAYARDKYTADRDYAAAYEPSGEDFFSRSLNEADLMRRVLAADEFAAWLTAFLPELEKQDGRSASLLRPAIVADISDPRIGHLAGLNLSRAWTQRGILSALPADDPRRATLEDSVRQHTESGLSYVFSGHYEGEHWLATFAVYLLTEAGRAENN